ncbi:MAG: 1-deoxy-D-xylulose-5-phosphate reductoisomerase, partial [Planctomycetes bacterium]|nr:1-deoxy-D-xylulose-5-phosphate reductoisomerase [Planctomycetota bacterium]
VQAFRNQIIPFTAIVELTERCLRNHHWIENPNLDQILEADHWARNEVNTLLKKEKIKQTN